MLSAFAFIKSFFMALQLKTALYFRFISNQKNPIILLTLNEVCDSI